LFASFEAGAVQRLFDGVGGQDAEDDRHAGVQPDPSHAGRDGASDMIVVVGPRLE